MDAHSPLSERRGVAETDLGDGAGAATDGGDLRIISALDVT
jgi:hypothetical protein